MYALSYFSQEKSRLATQLEQRQLELDSLSPDVKADASNVGVKAAQLKLLNAKESLRSYKQHIRQSILRVAIVFGLLMGLVGIRSLEGIIQYPAPVITLEIFRLYLFRVLDLGLTAGLIAGGSEGIHSLIKKLYSFFPDASQTVASSLQAVGKNVS
ncbi:hypothetical protein [Leptothoe kymatousa]|uniref:Uncharacterized protein n=1 Tax=Leptothoe kymatousa TAU-MAC 1615 TaxID=2364775 RepID=A0ABS5Y5A1_9CYAN|nr:hypothetical protein [Leptothoe kymatousa]MBT9312673.1 hypothetical protein [Leptothoe kymatousa TAU-MAC 1615]